MIRLVLAAFFLSFALLASGCGPSQELVDQQQSEIDSLHNEVEKWQLRYQATRDSLEFERDVETGRYYRERRVLLDRLDRMRFDLNLLQDGGRTVAVIEADDLFEPASATLTEQGQERLVDVAEQIREMFPNRPIRVEGHADNVPITGDLQEQYPTNWELSAARASSTARQLMDAHEFSEDRFQVLAFGDTQPVASNNTARGRERNRRVRIAVLPRLGDYARPYDESW